MHLFFRDFRAFCVFVDTYFLSFLKTNKRLFIHDVLTGFFSAGCHTLPQIAATRLRQAPAQPESRCNRLIRKPIPTIRCHRPGQRRNTPSASPPSAGSSPGTARRPNPHRLDASQRSKKRPGLAKPRFHQPQSAITCSNHNRKKPPASKPAFPAHGGSHSSAPRLPHRRPPTPRASSLRSSPIRWPRLSSTSFTASSGTKLRKPPAAAPS